MPPPKNVALTTDALADQLREIAKRELDWEQNVSFNEVLALGGPCHESATRDTWSVSRG